LTLCDLTRKYRSKYISMSEIYLISYKYNINNVKSDQTRFHVYISFMNNYHLNTIKYSLSVRPRLSILNTFFNRKQKVNSWVFFIQLIYILGHTYSAAMISILFLISNEFLFIEIIAQRNVLIVNILKANIPNKTRINIYLKTWKAS
jgi:hypothetical protein